MATTDRAIGRLEGQIGEILSHMEHLREDVYKEVKSIRELIEAHIGHDDKRFSEIDSEIDKLNELKVKLMTIVAIVTGGFTLAWDWLKDRLI